MGLKLTIFGLTVSSSWGNGHATPYRALIRALARRGHHVCFFEKDVEYYARHRDFHEWPWCELVLYQDWRSIRQRALACAGESDAVVVASYCPEGARIADEALGLAGPLHVYYDLDTPITLAGLRHGRVEYLGREQIPAFELYLSFTGGPILRELETRWGARLARPMYGCVDPDLYRRTSPDPRYQCDLSYMGTYAADRQAKLEALVLEPAHRLPDSAFVLAGSLYPPGRHWPRNLRKLEHVAPSDHAAFYSSSRVTLNITRAEMANDGYCPSGRFFEAAACGTAILTDRWEGLDEFFSPGKEILAVERGEDVVRALRLSHEELVGMAARARQRTLDEHTGDCRARQLLAWLEEARARRQSAGTQEVAS